MRKYQAGTALAVPHLDGSHSEEVALQLKGFVFNDMVASFARALTTFRRQERVEPKVFYTRVAEYLSTDICIETSEGACVTIAVDAVTPNHSSPWPEVGVKFHFATEDAGGTQTETAVRNPLITRAIEDRGRHAIAALRHTLHFTFTQQRNWSDNVAQFQTFCVDSWNAWKRFMDAEQK